MSLVLKNYVHHQGLTLVDFIYLFLTKLNERHETLFNEDDEDEIQCDTGRMRSLGDIADICKSYYPASTREQVKEILLNFGEDLVGHFCDTVVKRVYCHAKLYPSFVQGSIGERDEYGEIIEYREKNINILNPNL